MHRKGFFFECQEGSGLVKRLSLYHHIKTVTTYSEKKKKRKKRYCFLKDLNIKRLLCKGTGLLHVTILLFQILVAPEMKLHHPIQV